MYIVGRNVNWYSHCGNQYGGSSKKLKIELPYDPVIPLMDIYSKESKSVSRRDIFTPVIIATLLTIAKIWKQPMFPSTDEWIKKL